MVFIIGEIGINHNGDIEITKKLIQIAKKAGCDAVKFQKRTIEKVYTKQVLDSPRQSPWGTTTREQKMGLEFDKKEYDVINNYCLENKIEWFASAWDIDSQYFLQDFNLKHNKIASAMLTDIEFLNLVANEKKHTFISTGMSTMEEIEQAVKIFEDSDCPFELMHTNSSYPMKIEEANLLCIPMLKEKFGCNVGYSGHEVSAYRVSLIAVGLGATSLERHITLDRTMYGSDQAASLEPAGLYRLVRDVRTVNSILGDGKKRVWPSEVPIKEKLRKK
ncbi:MAG: N-acetylneuraminate synthase [Dehalococcoidia bacterium]|nr:N-acetylneuraminate synthase [Dehalococcoidia bacterium]|tara:strand:- start:3008 stop:3835 length:828 start_codon:yes stop_codon:yes gene_type:complete